MSVIRDIKIKNSSGNYDTFDIGGSAANITYDNSNSVKDKIDALGTASTKAYTTSIENESADLITSGAVYTALHSPTEVDIPVNPSSSASFANGAIWIET